MTISIDLLHVPDCPNVDVARRRLGEAISRAGVEAAVREREVADAEAAEALGMRGSPTILVGGSDPFPGEAPALACRLYPTAAGIEGAPSVDQLVAVLAGGVP